MKMKRQIMIGRADRSPTSGHEYVCANGHMAQCPIMEMAGLLAHSKSLISMESAFWHQSLLNYHRYQWMGCSAEIYDVGNNICQMEVVEISMNVICVQCIHSYVIINTCIHT